MPHFRKKPVVIEARQYAGGEDAAYPLIDWIDQSADDANAVYDPEDDGVAIKTLEGVMTAVPGDWIIRGVQGEFYPCKPGIFEATYESAGEEEDQLATSALAPAEALLAEIVADPDAYVARIRAARR